MFTYLLIFINAIISYKAYTASQSGSYQEMDKYLYRPYQLSRGGNIPGVILSNFSHADFFHFLFNMMTLFYFGRVVEYSAGFITFLSIYFLSGVGATLISYFRKKDDPYYQALGASGCISGILVTAAILYPQMSLYMMFIPIPIPAPIFAVLYILFSTLLMNSDSGIAHDAHLGGALVGLIAGGILAGGYGAFFSQLFKLF
ncbi:MAG: rhomboid family intramembrane serine protease [Leptospiraceae bacterium]|nr:rhomboid family intramembrane serine protease [Leptospiraceae bacterium]MCP5510316.1 rhomboid family intramembrane serine protease [Leptospiraceae bacterium]